MDPVLLKNPYINVKSNVHTVEISAKDILYETVDARSASQQNITFDLDAKGDNSLLCADAYVTGYFRFTRKTTADPAGTNTLDPRDRVCLRNNFVDDMILNSTFNYQGTNINSRPYLASRTLASVFEDDFYQRKYGGVGGGFSNLDSLDSFTRRPRRGCFIAKKIPIDGDNAAIQVTHQILSNFLQQGDDGNDPSKQGIEIDFNTIDRERQSKLSWFRGVISYGETDGVYKVVKVTFPVKLPPFKAHRKGHWFDKMSDAIPYVKNSSLNFQLKQQISGVALESFFKDNLNRTAGGVGVSVNPDFATDKDNSNSKFEFDVHPTRNWQLHLRWYQSPMPLQPSYSLKTWRMDHYLKAVVPIAAVPPNPQTAPTKESVTSDLIKVGSKPEYLLFYIAEDLQGNGRGNDTNFNALGADKGYVKAANVPIAGLDLQISNQQGVLTSNMDEDALWNYTKNNVNDRFAHGYETFKKYRNFILLKTSDLAAPNAPAGILQNCNIRATAKLGKYPYNTDEDGAIALPSYNFHIALIYTHTKLNVSESGVSISDDLSSASVYDQFIVKGIDSAPSSMMGVKSSYKSFL